MKKNSHKYLLAFVTISAVLFSCGPQGDTTSSTTSGLITSDVTTSTTTSIDPDLNSEELFISELFAGDNVFDAALEISSAKNGINLGNYSINFYQQGAVRYTLDLESKVLNLNESYCIANNSLVNATIKEKINYTLPDNYLTYKNYVEIVNRSSSCVVDSLGNKKFNLPIIGDIDSFSGSIMRFQEYYKSYQTFSRLRYFSVRSGITKYFGNLEVPYTLEEYMHGPYLNEIYSEYEFATSNNGSNGGYATTNVVSYGDGDTTVFNTSKIANIGSTEKTRYLFINTPEVNHNTGEPGDQDDPWGVPAQIFNNEKLRNASSIIIQSNRNASLRETYGRLLGYIWYASVANPTLADYRLLNYDMIINGYSKLLTSNKYSDMYDSKDILYYDFMSYANDYASSLGIGVFGQVDPHYDYSNSTYIK